MNDLDWSLFKTMVMQRKDPIEFMDGVITGVASLSQTILENSNGKAKRMFETFSAESLEELTKIQLEVENEILKDLEEKLTIN